MCARFGIASELDWAVFAVSSPQGQLPLDTECRPTDKVPGITEFRGQRKSFLLPWGLHPDWSNRPVINARAETAASKPTFRREFAHQRCLIPCHSWFEWTGEKGHKQKHEFSAAKRQQLALAGLWFRRSRDDPDGAVVILTTAANDKCAAYHDRMPLVIMPDQVDTWLNEQTSPELIAQLAHPAPESLIEVRDA